MDYTSLTPVSKIQVSQVQQQPQSLSEGQRPLDRPTLVRPQRTSTVLIHQQQNEHSASSPIIQDNNNPRLNLSTQQNVHTTPQYNNQAYLPPQMPYMDQREQTYTTQAKKLPEELPPEKELRIEVIPMNLEKPTGLDMGDFLPMKFQMMGLGGNTLGGCDTSRFSGFKSYANDLSEAEVTQSMLKGHESMMAALTNRGRQVEIIQKLWQNKDAKTAVDQAVLLNDPSVLVDLLTVITLRPSIWNLDLCTALLPPLEKLLQSKYEMYITVGCDAMKLILKNFGSVIKSNIDSPIQTVGVDISREERHNKCMECYKDLVKIRSLILKRQAMQGKLGHTFRELSILMQYLD